MMDFEPRKRETFLSIAGKTNHLHIICTNPFFNRETGEISVLAVNISSVRQGGSLRSHLHLTCWGLSVC